MEHCPELIERCLLHVDVPQPHCLFCSQPDWRQPQLSYHNDPISYGDLQSADLSLDGEESIFNFSANSELSHPFPHALVTQPVATLPLTRRRNWTVEENCDFERWITNNPNPTKQQKQDFADSHHLLTAAHVQSKINNWRNGRNSRRKQSTHRSEGGVDIFENKAQDIDQSMDGDTAESKYWYPSPTGSTIDDLLREVYSQETFLNLIDDTVEIRGELVEEVRAEIRNLKTRIQEMKRDTTTAASSSRPTGFVDERPSSPPSSFISSTELDADIDHIDLTLQNASTECLRARSVAEDVEETSQSADDGHNLSNAPPFEQSNACGRCIALGALCDGELPCSRCDRIGVPCSNCMPESHAESFEPDTQKHSSASKFEGGNLAALRLTLLGGLILDNPAKKRSPSPSPSLRHTFSQSRAHSVASAATSRSVASMHSARYSLKLNRRLSANSRRNSSESRSGIRDRRESGPAISYTKSTRVLVPPSAWKETKVSMTDNEGGGYFRCPIIRCPEVFTSRLSLHTHEELVHSQSYCTFCSQPFRDKELWQAHEERHIMHEIGATLNNDHILWKCGICGTFGLSEVRRHLHLVNHWQDGYTMKDWEGKPMIISLDSVETCRLTGLSKNALQVAAQHMLLRRSENVLHSSTTSMKDFLNIQHPPKEGESPLNATTKEQKNYPSDWRPQAVPEPARSVVHGLFASIRNKLLRSKKKSPKPPEMKVHSFGPEEARSQYQHHKS